MTVFGVILTRFDGDEDVARRYCRGQAKRYRKLAKRYPKLTQLAEGYERAEMPRVRRNRKSA